MRVQVLLAASTLLWATGAMADHTDSRLNPLFARLLMEQDLPTIRETENQIWEIWYEHPNADAERLLQLGIQRMNYNRFGEAMLIFSQLLESFPAFAEGWNKRATLHYLLGNFDESVADIERTLALEPRHFGALSGLGLVYMQREQMLKAKQAFESLIEVHPNSPNAKRNLEAVNNSLRFGVI